MTGRELVDRWAGWMREYAVMSEAQAIVLALWAMHTHFSEHFAATPYLSITATTKQSGKTTVLDMLHWLCRNAEKVATIRPISIARTIGAFEGKCTILIDEAEKLASAQLGETRTMLATGYRKGAYHMITSKHVERFPTYAPKAFATIGDIQDVLRDRSIVFDLVRGVPSKSLTLCWVNAQQQAGELVSLMGGWFAEHAVRRITIIDPDWLTAPRDREIWSPLFSLAATLDIGKHAYELLAGFSVDNQNFKRLPARVYHSVQDEDEAEDRTMSLRALHDLRAVFAEGETFIPSTVAVERMRANPYGPWRTWRGKGLDEISLAALLSLFGVESKRRQLGKGRKDRTQYRGYVRTDVFAKQDV